MMSSWWLPCVTAALLLLVAGAPAVRADGPSAAGAFFDRVRTAPARAVPSDPQAHADLLKVERTWVGNVCQSWVVNTGAQPARVSEVVLFDLPHELSPETPLLGEGFTMLALNGGTLEKPLDWGSLPDRKHYRIPEPESLRTAYGMISLQLAPAEHAVLGFTACDRFIGRISFDAKRLRVSLDTENLELAPGRRWKLEPLMLVNAPTQAVALEQLCAEIARNHPPSCRKPVPTGWCSWSCFGPGVTSANILSNLDWISAHFPQLRYIQIDDGYQPWMGDWLETGQAFGGGVQDVLKQIKGRGFEPAIWVAPFVASPQSKLFHDHPDWFVKDDGGQPLRSDRVTFGGWREGPWYALDGTNPAAQSFLEETFRTMHSQWGCTYFKLDANFWGAMQGGHHFDPDATRIEAYRRGMQAIRRGAGDAYLLGCNHPLWPSLGLIDGSRSSGDISRSWHTFKGVGRENLLRAWQNGRLWWNDPDCVLLTGGTAPRVMDAGGNKRTAEPLTENEFLFHATTVLASGGMLLSGDNLPTITPERESILKKLYPPTSVATSFADNTLEIGRIQVADREIICLFNWDDTPATRTVTLQHKSRMTDFWTGEDLGTAENEYRVDLPARTAKAIILTRF